MTATDGDPAGRAGDDLAAGRVLVDVEDRVATVTLHHPRVRNALTMAMWGQLERVFSDLDLDDSVLAVVVRGSGGDFCTGADVNDLPDDPAEFDRANERAEAALATCRHPVVAAIEGHCVGGGCEIAVAADLRFAHPDAVFGISANRLGVVYPQTPTRRLVEVVGSAQASRLLLGGELLDAAWALRVALVHELADDPVATATAYARSLTTRSAASIREAKRRLRGTTGHEPDAVSDYREGTAAFREHRPADFPSLRPRP